MRHITKQDEPQALLQWKADNRNTPENLRYNRGGFPVEAVRLALMREQHYLCAYTMKPLQNRSDVPMGASQSCHIEHILPQSKHRDGRDIDHRNMLACHPSGQENTVVCRFGAHAKANWDPESAGIGGFVSPLTAGVESHFSFDDRGRIYAETDAAETTIRVLNLNHPELVNDRRAVIVGALRPAGKELSAAAARRLALNIVQAKPGERLQPYCTAIAEAALRLALRKERRAARITRHA